MGAPIMSDMLVFTEIKQKGGVIHSPLVSDSTYWNFFVYILSQKFNTNSQAVILEEMIITSYIVNKYFIHNII